ncbi:MAG: hypothetical protein R2880_11365 [Deinococcales bacterium]
MHLEFEAHVSAEVMAFRMLEYRSRLAYTYRKPVYSIILYIGSAGRGDSGQHWLSDSMMWRYEVIRLEDMSSDTLLATDNLPVIAMMGLTKQAPQDMLQGLDKLETRD